MKPQYTNQLLSSYLLYLDNKILTRGEAYVTGVSTEFYPNSMLYNGYYTYSAPHDQIIADSSITGANIMTGVYVNKTFIGTGQSGLYAIDYYNGRLYFSGELPASTIISGTYSIKEYNIVMTTMPDEKILFETKYSPKPKYTQTLSGLNSDETPYPIIFVRSNTMTNEPFQFGGTELSKDFIRLIIMSDSQFSNDAINSIVRDTKNGYVPIFNEDEFPFNYLGTLKSGYNYTGITANKTSQGNSAFVEDVFIAKFDSQEYSQQLREISNEVYSSIVDLTLTYPRSIVR